MAEYIGARISLISNADIRYVGTLREINSTDSTVKLENVRSMGTEDRRSGPGSIAPNDRLYESIVFRGSDVKDLRIEEPPKAAPKKEEVEVPDDPAILSVSNDNPNFSVYETVWGDEEFPDVKLYCLVQERKTVWIFPLPSF